jgi:hypothetical protein
MYNKSSGFYADEDDYVFLLDSDAATFTVEDGDIVLLRNGGIFL